MHKKSFYNLDVNAGWGTDPELWNYLQAVLKDCINPSSVHQGGQKAKFLIEEAREDLKKLISAKDAKVIFTSGASESNNLILNSVFDRPEGSLIVSAVEHISLLEPARQLGQRGVELIEVYPSEGKSYSSLDFIEKIKPSTKMISLMSANNETGDIYPLYETVQSVKSLRKDIIFHSDAVQAAGKYDFSFDASMLDAASISGHKIGAFPGIGALIVREGLEVTPLIKGGPQEGRLRAGTENLPGIVSLGYMARKVAQNSAKRIASMKRSTEKLKEILFGNIENLVLNSFSQSALPNTLNIRVDGLRSDDLVVALDLEGVLISSAAACSSGKPLPSHVLLAYGLSEQEAKQSVRLSLPDNLSEREVETAAYKIIQCVKQMRADRHPAGSVQHAV